MAIISSFILRSPGPSLNVSSRQQQPWLCHSGVDSRLQWWFATEIPNKVKKKNSSKKKKNTFHEEEASHGLSVDRYQWDQSLSFQYVDVFPLDATTFTVTGLQPVTSYNFSINALNAIGESDYADNNAILTITTMGQFGATWASDPNKSILQSSISQWNINRSVFYLPSMFLDDRQTRIRRGQSAWGTTEWVFYCESSLVISICRTVAVCDWSTLVLAITMAAYM